jgi:guanine deaminase
MVRMTQMMPSSVVIGSVLQAPSPTRLEHLADVAVVVAADGTIVAVVPAGSSECDAACQQAPTVVRLGPNQRLLPGLIDLHIHAPQWPQLGTGLDLPLEQWLFENTFPLEARYADAAFAQSVWADMVPTLLAHGTTTAVYFSSIHEEATELLAATCSRFGQRAFVGRVAMDHPDATPPWYRDASAADGVAASERSLAAIASLGDPLVQPIITPRFVPACTDDLLAGLGRLAARTGVRVQTHCSESDWEHGAVIDRFGGDTDAVVLQRFGLLRDHAVLAHGDHLGDDDLALVRTAGSGVAHCPLSNSYFANAVFPAARAMARGVRVGLGTDVAGGSHPGLLPQCAMAVTVSRMLDDGVDPAVPAGRRGVPGSRIDTVAAFHLATAGGAEVLGIPCGLIEVGRSFDAFVVDLDRRGGALRVWDGIDDEARVFEKIVRLAGPDDISAVWVSGRQVSGS